MMIKCDIISKKILAWHLDHQFRLAKIDLRFEQKRISILVYVT